MRGVVQLVVAAEEKAPEATGMGRGDIAVLVFIGVVITVLMLLVRKLKL